ncbi:glycosyl hydrolase [Marinimicrobium agarilyticum]|uniref:glycosyl hydrolase n=1 Tax=Marinimicrobium agarilyticum TaxID=306546 RepID=UPI0004172C08|nr:glycosyl hydrolase [Marinimicrobium agarilyticum]
MILQWGLVVVGLTLVAACKAPDEYGAGSVSARIYPQSYQCEKQGDRARVRSAGVVYPEVPSCEGQVRPHQRLPQTVAPAARKPTMAHRWWGNVAFFGEHGIGDPDGIGYITPDPLTARITERGMRLMGIPAGLRVQEDRVTYPIPNPLDEVFDGIALANSQFDELDAFVRDYSDGSVTLEWRSGHRPVMAATFVQGSPYVYLSVYRGDLLLRTHAPDGEHKGVFHQTGNTLGLWTDVAGQRNHFLLTGHGDTAFRGLHGREIRAVSKTSHFTLTWLPVGEEEPTLDMVNAFLAHARQPVDEVRVEYQVDPADYSVTVSHQYRYQGQPVETLAGLQPLHWKNSKQVLTDYQVRSSRGLLRFAQTDGFDYQLAYTGVLPGLPPGVGDYDPKRLQGMIRAFVDSGPGTWTQATDTYWAGKQYGKVAELALLARTHGMTAEADALIDGLKAELEDWFRAEEQGQPKAAKYFVYDERWHTVLGVHESFGAHQALNDHHFHYGYFVRAAAEICRVDPHWCSASQWGPMVELLIRDYAAGRDDSRFPYLRHFDPAFGFSWASGSANYLLGNNNESTSEAASAYGAMILYGLVTDQPELVDRGVYLHASTAAAFWEYWSDIDGYRDEKPDFHNFPRDYNKITTSIVWGSGHVFATWFSDAHAHILGIQGLPSSPLILHLGQHPGYLRDYVELGLSEAVNGKPSGLPDGQWRDIWWNIWAMTDADAAMADMAQHGFDYAPEEGETKAHSYHWVSTWQNLGHLAMGALTADDPAAVAFEKGGRYTYIAYNFDRSERRVTFSDGTVLTVAPGSFEIQQSPGKAPRAGVSLYENAK